MKTFLFSMALALLGWMAVSNDASAATIITPNPVASVGNTFAPNASVYDAYQFSFTGTANGTFGGSAAGIAGFTANICGDEACSSVLIPGTPGSFFGLDLSGGTIASLLTGTYYLVFSGVTSSAGGGYSGLLSLNVTPTVPVPASLLLFVTALGGLGTLGFLRRKDKAAA